MKHRCALLALVGPVVLFQGLNVSGQSKPGTMEEMHKLHRDPKAFIALLDDPERDEYQKPHEVMMALGIREGERIADIGSGSGYFTLRFASHVGKAGVVYAVDVDRELIAHLEGRVREAGIENVRTVLAPPDNPRLPTASLDRIFICDTWHHIGDREKYLASLGAALKPGGQIVVIDYHRKEMPFGPPMEMRLSREDVLREFEGGGFRLQKEETFLPNQYFLVFVATPR
jgi:ubiquinone/menaquinone biosynthesis C-methylase UbiE